MFCIDIAHTYVCVAFNMNNTLYILATKRWIKKQIIPWELFAFKTDAIGFSSFKAKATCQLCQFTCNTGYAVPKAAREKTK